jgi:molecular chaperone GrpE (heat shock protein)
MKKTKLNQTVAKAGSKPAVKTVAKKAILKPVAKPIVRKAAKSAAPVKTKGAPPTPVTGIEALRQEITALRTQFSRQMAPVTTGSMEEVDALRRVLNDLMEARMNDVIRELVTIRNSAATAGGEARRISEQMDALLSDLGAMKFEAERLEHIDPLIHAVSREVSDPSLPDGIIIATLRPGFHTSRGIIVAKALVSVNRRS